MFKTKQTTNIQSLFKHYFLLNHFYHRSNELVTNPRTTKRKDEGKDKGHDEDFSPPTSKARPTLKTTAKGKNWPTKKEKAAKVAEQGLGNVWDCVPDKVNQASIFPQPPRYAPWESRPISQASSSSCLSLSPWSWTYNVDDGFVDAEEEDECSNNGEPDEVVEESAEEEDESPNNDDNPQEGAEEEEVEERDIFPPSSEDDIVEEVEEEETIADDEVEPPNLADPFKFINKLMNVRHQMRDHDRWS